MMIKTKLIEDAVLTYEDRIDDRINKFILQNQVHIKVVDIKYATAHNRLTALIIYEVKDND